MTHPLYLVIAKHPRWSRWQRIVKVCKRKPQLQQDRVMVKLEVSIPDNIFDPPIMPVVVSESQIIRPEIKATAVKP